MSEPQRPDSSDRADRPGKTRTWWHPLLARLLDFELATAYAVRDEVLVGRLPLRVDILLIRRESGQLRETSRRDLSVLLCYTLQQIEQFRRLGEEFAMQHAGTEYFDQLEDELQVILEGISVERRLRGLPAEERLRGLPAEERLRGLTPEELADSLTEEQAARLRELLERRQGT